MRQGCVARLIMRLRLVGACGQVRGGRPEGAGREWGREQGPGASGGGSGQRALELDDHKILGRGEGAESAPRVVAMAGGCGDGGIEVGEPVDDFERVRVEHQRGLCRREALGRFIQPAGLHPVARLLDLPCENAIEGDAAMQVGVYEPSEVLRAVVLRAQIEEEAAARRRRRRHDLGAPERHEVVRREHKVAVERVAIFRPDRVAQEPRVAQELHAAHRTGSRSG